MTDYDLRIRITLSEMTPEDRERAIGAVYSLYELAKKGAIRIARFEDVDDDVAQDKSRVVPLGPKRTTEQLEEDIVDLLTTQIKTKRCLSSKEICDILGERDWRVTDRLNSLHGRMLIERTKYRPFVYWIESTRIEDD